MRTATEIMELKQAWDQDPFWDLYNTEGYEEHKEELRAYQEKREKEWRDRAIQRKKELDEEADKLGVRGIYRLVKKHEELLERHEKAMNLLADGNGYQAYKVLAGMEE
jgi:hypothetical protein